MTVTAGPAVTKTVSGPYVVPAPFAATRRKWYAVPAVSSPMGTDAVRAPGLELWLCVAVRTPYAVVGPYSKYHEVEWPRASTEPLSVAVVEVTALAAAAVTPGGPVVVKVWSAPALVPIAFVATTR